MNPDQLSAAKPILKAVSVVMIVVGAALTLAFFSSFSSGMNDLSSGPPDIGLAFIGMPLLGLGSALAKFAFLGEVAGYVANETAPAARTLLGGALGSSVRCEACAQANDSGARFCEGCGSALQAACPACSAANSGDARFCDSCGASLRT